MFSKRLLWTLSKAPKIIPKIVKNGESPRETKKSLTVKWETLKMKITKLPETNAGPETHQAVACFALSAKHRYRCFFPGRLERMIPGIIRGNSAVHITEINLGGAYT